MRFMGVISCFWGEIDEERFHLGDQTWQRLGQAGQKEATLVGRLWIWVRR